jgi:hypothetical protein
MIVPIVLGMLEYKQKKIVRLVIHVFFFRKEEYKIEVLIPPNISDPLNLNAEDDSDYEAKLVSPLIKKKKVCTCFCLF